MSDETKLEVARELAAIREKVHGALVALEGIESAVIKTGGVLDTPKNARRYLHDASVCIRAQGSMLERALWMVDALRALPVADDAGGVKRAKVDPHMLAQLGADWSQPVQVKVDHEDRDGDLVLLCKSLPPAPDDAAELAALREADAQYRTATAAGTNRARELSDLLAAARALLAKRDGQGVG